MKRGKVFKTFCYIWGGLLVFITLAQLFGNTARPPSLRNYGMIKGIALDVSSKKKNNILATVQLVNPTNLMNNSGSSQSNYFNYSAEGGNVEEALANVTDMIPLNVNFSHTGVLLLSKDVLKEQRLYEICEIFIRNHDYMQELLLVVSDAKTAKETLEVFTPIKDYSSNEIIATVARSGSPLFANSYLPSDVLNTSRSQGKDIVLPIISILGDEKKSKNIDSVSENKPQVTFETNKWQMFNGEEPTGVISEPELDYMRLLNKKIFPQSLNFQCENGKEASIRLNSSSGKMKIISTKGTPTIEFKIKIVGKLALSECKSEGATDFKFEQKIEKKLEENIVKEYKLLYELSKKYNSDFFAFEQALRIKDPNKATEMANKFEYPFKHFNIKISPDVEIVNIGDINRYPNW